MNSLMTLATAFENQLLILSIFSYEEGAVQILGSLSAKVIKKKAEKRSCHWCHTLFTPLWRKGPYTESVLCNACGTRFLRIRKANPCLSLEEIIKLSKSVLSSKA
jgi:hypothetical protein